MNRPLAAALLLAMLAAPAPWQAALAQPAAPSGTDPHLSVAAVRMAGGRRVSKIIGSTVVNDHNETVGTVDDLMLAEGNTVAVAVISVGGVLGIGSKLVAVGYDTLQAGQDGKLVWPGATKQSLAQMPSFTYGS